jgi:hypothetical protein
MFYLHKKKELSRFENYFIRDWIAIYSREFSSGAGNG